MEEPSYQVKILKNIPSFGTFDNLLCNIQNSDILLDDELIITYDHYIMLFDNRDKAYDAALKLRKLGYDIIVTWNYGSNEVSNSEAMLIAPFSLIICLMGAIYSLWFSTNFVVIDTLLGSASFIHWLESKRFSFTRTLILILAWNACPNLFKLPAFLCFLGATVIPQVHLHLHLISYLLVIIPQLFYPSINSFT